MVFFNGHVTPLFQTNNSLEFNETLKIVPIEEGRRNTPIRYARMRVTDESSFYSGIRLLGPEKEVVFDIIWNRSGKWSNDYEIIEGTKIVGMKMDTVELPDRVRRFSLLLGLENQPILAGEVRFPIMEVYPSYFEFKSAYIKNLGDWSPLDKIVVKKQAGHFEMTGIQLIFEDGTRS